MAGETRVDIISGPCGAGKTSFIRQLMRSGPSRDEVIVCGGVFIMDWFERNMRYRPKRVVLEAPGDLGFSEALTQAIGGRATPPYAVGAKVAVLDARCFSLNMQEVERIGDASHVYLNRTNGLNFTVQAQMLRAVWGINPRVNILVEPLEGINLWNLLDNIPVNN